MPAIPDAEQIETVKAAWIAALKAGDVDLLMSLVTDDVVAMHPSGKTTQGKQEMADDFQRFFAKFRIDQTAICEECIVAGEWAFERSRVNTKLEPIAGGQASEVDSKVVVILRRTADGNWKVARTIAVLG